MRALVRTWLVTVLTVIALVPVTGSASAERLARAGVDTSSTSGAAVITWNSNAAKAALGSCLAPANNPLHESRMYAMMHIAIHDALNAIDRRSRPYALDIHVTGASPVAAVAAAAHGVLVPVLEELPAPFSDCVVNAKVVAGVEDDYAAAISSIPDGSAKTRGLALGRAAAAVILAVRAADGSDTTLFDTAYPQGTKPGEYRFTPGFNFALAPGWADVTPFVLKASSQFRPGPPDAVTSARYTKDFNEVKRLGGDGVTTPSARTAAQTQIARFWVESSPLLWNRLARTVAVQKGLDLWESSRLFGLLNMALADGYVATFDTKYKAYNYWRPVTAIQNAATDGNPKTKADPTWTPLVPTPPIPDYDSGHSVEGGAAAQVLKRFFGTDRMHFTSCSFTLPPGQTCTDASPVLRRFTSFSQARDENGLSRILVGFHFRKAVEVGIDHGVKIGDRAVDAFLRPVHSETHDS
ncbi:MAG: hypothetical protein QOC73_2062 [Actinomycetota bacterium]|jgi:hypothetical protein|nr:hypothetical protein [Actinomycetota bacterium]